ncbi:regulator of microtubule dynamics protein 3 [Pygocentrus nattereri]|uniref:Regulator of microtubule dynamics protein 3 n=1 Tax=Pygocentrus nattereri TaxID=42514 RepID=A0AAR2K2V2_PYGNA|nr:regulator of microtubule dynamics protein 3 [Pygocentrus nattereri]
MSSVGRSGLIGLGVGVTVSTGVIAFLIIREMLRRRNQRLLLEAGGPGQLVVDGRLSLTQRGRDPALLASALRGLTPEQHVELRNTLDEVMMSVSSLRNEVAELRSGLREIASTIIEDVRKGVEEGQRSRRRRHYLPRERSDSMSSSSIYFTASASLYGDSEGGYSTAYSNVESDYTDRETDKEENGDEQEEDDDKDSEDEEERSCATVLTLRQDDSQAEEEDGEDDEGATAAVVAVVTEEPSPELAFLLTHSDLLHAGDSGKKAEGFHLLRENKPLYGDSVAFLWRLARAYNDMCEHAEDQEERRSYAEQGRDEAEAALQRNGLNAECHKWFAVLTGQSSQYESMHGKLKSSHILKEHLDRALSLRDDDPLCFYLLGRWCFEVSRLSWVEKKAAAALFDTLPNSCLNDALENFLKAEELNPGFSRTVRLYIAKCHKELGNHSEARNWAQLALSMPSSTGQETDISGLEAELQALIDSAADS